MPDIVEQLPKLPLEPIMKLETYALAAVYAHACAWRIRRLSPTRDLVTRAKPLRAKLLVAADLFAHVGFIDAAQVDQIKSGNGRMDVARDLIALEALLTGAWPRITGTTLITQEDLRQGANVGSELLHAIAHGERSLQDHTWGLATRDARRPSMPRTIVWVSSKDDIRAAALRLPPAERADLAYALLESLDLSVDPGAAGEWVAELERRAQAVSDGSAKLVDWDAARERITARLKSRRVG